MKDTVEFLYGKKLTDRINDLINLANEKLYIVCPFINEDEELNEMLNERADNGVNVILITRKNLAGYSRNIKLLMIRKLHSKVYLNEKGCIVGSENLTDSMNEECGIYIDSRNKVYQEILDYVIMLEFGFDYTR